MAYNRKLLYTKSFPSWDTPEGNLGNFFNGATITPIQLVATEINEPGSTITYAVTTGALPTGLTLSSSGEISGTTTGYNNNETVNFTITATDDEGETAFRNFSFTVSVNYEIDYLVVAGGGGGGSNSAGGGGGGGLRTSYGSISGRNSSPEPSFVASPSTNYTIIVGAGGAAVSYNNNGLRGGNSSFSNITSIGGGGGALLSQNNSDGGSGAGGTTAAAGLGTAGQGFDGGLANSDQVSYTTGGGGGGTGASGGNAIPTSGGNGGNGLAISITGSSVLYGGGGGGAGDSRGSRSGGSGGAGGGGNGGYNGGAGLTAGSPQTGGGGGGNGYSTGSGVAGGSGIVILRMPTISYSGNTTGSPTVTTNGSDTILTYTGSGTYTA